MGDIVTLVNKFGFPIVAAVGMGGLIWHVYRWATIEIKPVLSESNKTLVALIDRIRLLDNDLLRLDQRVSTVLELRSKAIERERIIAETRINKPDDVRRKVSSTGVSKSVDKSVSNRKTIKK